MNDGYEPPQDVIDEWLEHCDCCRICGCAPCDGVAAGGLCDEQCHCRNDHEDAFHDSEDEQ